MIRAACMLIVGPDRRVVAVARRTDPTAFGMPGGKLELGETAVEAAIRETEQETGVWVYEHRNLHTGFDAHNNHVTTYLALKWSGDPTPQPGEPTCGWRDWGVLLNGPFAAYNVAVRGAFHTYLRRLGLPK